MEVIQKFGVVKLIVLIAAGYFIIYGLKALLTQKLTLNYTVQMFLIDALGGKNLKGKKAVWVGLGYVTLGIIILIAGLNYNR